jgi:hypothetical protein
VPGLHDRHMDTSLAPVPGAYVPAGHIVHVVEPGVSVYVPTLQSKQEIMSTAPVDTEYVPRLHASQRGAPADNW